MEVGINFMKLSSSWIYFDVIIRLRQGRGCRTVSMLIYAPYSVRTTAVWKAYVSE